MKTIKINLFMKNFILTILCLCSVASYAQNGFFLQPEIGIGISNANVVYPRDYINYPWGISWNAPLKNIFTYNPQILIGYQFSHWSVVTGISFLKTGFIEDSAVAGSGGASFFSYKETEYFYHFIVPVSISYKFSIGRRFFIVPGIGASFLYTYSSVEKTNNYYSFSGSTYTDHTLTDNEFNNNYKHIGVVGTAQINFEYKLNERLNVVAGPEYQAMLSSMLTNTNNEQKNYAYTFNAGIAWHF
jgi:hypothetical protein